jgi:hypothetical protein
LPRQPQVQVENTLSRGLITEVSGLNFPENGCTETYNCKIDNRGVVMRRLGFDYEGGNSTFVSVRNNSAISEFVWKAPAGDGTLTYVVIQIGALIYFYEEDVDGPLSPGKETFTIDLTSFDTTGNPGVGLKPCQFAAGKGYLFIAHPYCDPIYVSYSAAGPSVTGTAITIKQRDFDGLTSTATYPDNVTRPTSSRAALDDFDEYNLQNQGWDRVVNDNDGNNVNALDEWDTNNTTMPALSDIWSTFHDNADPQEFNFTVNGIHKFPPSTGRAPQGHYILNSFLQERDVASGIAGLSNDDVTAGVQRPKTIAFYAGRVWYAGTDAAGYNSTLYFSQIIENDRQFGRCHQENDPTSDQNSDLLPSDGGTLKILEAATVVKLFTMGNQLLVFASNGIWAISGSSDGGLGFSASDFSVTRISSIGAVSGNSFVDIDGAPAWWNYQGIWTVTPGQLGDIQVVSLTKDTIQDFYEALPVISREYAKGAYNTSTKVIQWVYRSTVVSDVDDLHNYDSVLWFDLQKKAFFPWTIDTTQGVLVNGIVCIRGDQVALDDTPVVDSTTALVVDSTAEQVVSSQAVSSIAGSAFRYLVTKNTSGTDFTTTWATESATDYEDWDSPATGTSYSSYFVTGYKLHGEAQRYFESNYLTIYFNNISNGSCNFQAIWDYATSSAGGRFSDAKEVYRVRSNVSVQQARVKVRGRGRALQFKFYSTANKPFELLGWSAWETSNANI